MIHLFLVAAVAPAFQVAPVDVDAKWTAVLTTADAAISDGKPQQALDLLAPAIAALEAPVVAEPRQSYCGMSPAETLAYMAIGTQTARGAIAIGPDLCRALYLRGYALFDLNRIADARAAYQRAVALAPMHAHFLAELGQTYRMTKDWGPMLDTCKQAMAATTLTPDAERKREQGFALRCQGYALIEQGDWDRAEAMYRQCLSLDPADANASHELQYIAEQRRRPRA